MKPSLRPRPLPRGSGFPPATLLALPLLAAALAGCRGPAPASPRPSAASAVESFDTTSAGALPAGWLAAQTGAGRPDWQVVADATAPSPPGALRQAGVAAFPLCVRTNVTLRDGFVETRFKPLAGVKDQAGGVVWRWRDADNYYLCRANALENNVVLYKVQNGRRSSLDIVGRTGGYGVGTPVAGQVWHHLRVEFRGTRHRVFFNGRHQFDVEDAVFEAPGHVGVWTKADSVTLFDDFRFGGPDVEP